MGKILRVNIRTISIKSRGFTLLEIIVAVGILGMVLLPFLTFISYRLARERVDDETIKAIEIAKATMEEMLVLPRIQDEVWVIADQFTVVVKVLDGDMSDEPQNLYPVEIVVSIYRISDERKLIEIHALK